MTSTDAKSVVLAYLKAIDERDAEAIQATLWEDAEFRIPGEHPLAGSWVGLDEILNKFMLPLMELFSTDVPYTIEMTQVIAEGDTVVLDCVARAASRSGRPYEAPIVSVFAIQDGRIKAMREFFDTQYFVRTLFGDDNG
ncbi:nuclear transport factor 2 family protein [Streptomyces sp. NPDC091289]|uniref:nuclear transport factor 2 family protein n=1 Tax=Streptomyces sp. NPDC091289 TaxID=3365989 RepID=UPI0038224047